MSEMVDRVVLVLIERTQTFSCGSMDYEEAARAIIAAMREPTPEVLAGAAAEDYRVDAPRIWRAMIDAALADETMTAPTHPKTATGD